MVDQCGAPGQTGEVVIDLRRALCIRNQRDGRVSLEDKWYGLLVGCGDKFVSCRGVERPSMFCVMCELSIERELFSEGSGIGYGRRWGGL